MCIVQGSTGAVFEKNVCIFATVGVKLHYQNVSGLCFLNIFVYLQNNQFVYAPIYKYF